MLHMIESLAHCALPTPMWSPQSTKCPEYIALALHLLSNVSEGFNHMQHSVRISIDFHKLEPEVELAIRILDTLWIEGDHIGVGKAQ